ncbi:MAG: DUF4091 domain-containing protein [Kiritimatiellae bacterium]|nr:DUF4091 domain-containing protein [Kiritimatiellia bacterium]
MRSAIALLSCLTAAAGFGAVTIFDFEDPAEQAAMPKVDGSDRVICVTNAFATSGGHSLFFGCKSWKKGMDQWPSFTITPPVSDWSKFDRMAVDLVNLGDGGDRFHVYLAEKEGRIQNGLLCNTTLPAHGYRQWIVPLKGWPKTANPHRIARVHFFASEPLSQTLFIDRITLLEKGETPPAPDSPSVGRDLLPLMSDRVAASEAEQSEVRAEMRHLDAYWRFREQCNRAGSANADMLVGQASTMTHILPRGEFSAQGAHWVNLRLARNESEGIQILVSPVDHSLKNVRVAVGDLKRENGNEIFGAANWSCDVMGYVKTARHPPYKVGYNTATNEAPGFVRKLKCPEPGWWPDPILSFMHQTDIAGRDVQSFWLQAKCPEHQAAGVYQGKITVSADNAEPVIVLLTLRVNDFAIGKESPLPMAITFAPNIHHGEANDAEWQATAKAIRDDPDSPINAWKKHEKEWGDFLADHYITMDSLYHRGTIHFEVLKRLKEQGRLGKFNLGYWHYFDNSEGAEQKWRDTTLASLKKMYAQAKEYGLLDHAYVYGCDEINKEFFPNIRRCVEILKKELPGVPISTTAYDHEFGVGTELDCMDWFTPLTPKFDIEKASASRAKGHQVWWYICCGPHAPHANMFIECQPIEARILMGAMTTRMRPDGFLYYQISIWNSAKSISSGPFTDWNPRSWTTYHGDGAWTCVGPDGIPLSTQRLQNFRDGLEDYAYAKVLEARLKKAGNRNPEWSGKAAAALQVSRNVLQSMTLYTDDPNAVLGWRDVMANLIESAPKAD